MITMDSDYTEEVNFYVRILLLDITYRIVLLLMHDKI